MKAHLSKAEGRSAPEWAGSWTALVTPFRRGGLDEAALRDLVEWQIRQGIAGLVPCGTTGEAATLRLEERVHVVELVVKAARGRVPVVAGAGTNDTELTIQVVRAVKEAGADGALIVAPYYNKPTARGVKAHYERVAEAVQGFPVMAYNIPSRTGITMDPDTLADLARSGAIAAVKDSTGNMEEASRLLAALPPTVPVFSGEDALTLPFLALGAKGAVSVASNVIPKEMVALVAAGLAGEMASARRLHFQWWPLFKALFIETSPVPVKTALAWMGVIHEDAEVRLPLVPLEPGHTEALRAVLQRLGVAPRAASLVGRPTR